jgi:hypothetical protein
MKFKYKIEKEIEVIPPQFTHVVYNPATDIIHGIFPSESAAITYRKGYMGAAGVTNPNFLVIGEIENV